MTALSAVFNRPHSAPRSPSPHRCTVAQNPESANRTIRAPANEPQSSVHHTHAAQSTVTAVEYSLCSAIALASEIRPLRNGRIRPNSSRVIAAGSGPRRTPRSSPSITASSSSTRVRSRTSPRRDHRPRRSRRRPAVRAGDPGDRIVGVAGEHDTPNGPTLRLPLLEPVRRAAGSKAGRGLRGDPTGRQRRRARPRTDRRHGDPDRPAPWGRNGDRRRPRARTAGQGTRQRRARHRPARVR